MYCQCQHTGADTVVAKMQGVHLQLAAELDNIRHERVKVRVGEL